VRLQHIKEPELRFGLGQHVDVRFGIMNYGVLDYGDGDAPRSLKVGIVGPTAAADALRRWLDRCSEGVGAPPSRQPHLFPRFPGFDTDGAFYSEVVHSAQTTAAITQGEAAKLEKISRIEAFVHEAAELYEAKVRELTEDQNVDVVLCAPSIEMADRTINEAFGRGMPNFHHLLKARAMGTRVPTQIVLPMTYDPTKKLKRKRVETDRRVQDEATRAWNFFTALYYKAGGVPWRLPKVPSDLETCYVGVSFYTSLDDDRLETSLAQVFNERGEGVIVKGGAASITKGDRRPYLEAGPAKRLLGAAVDRYRKEHRHHPARVVVHKTSPFQASELEGFVDALAERDIEVWDFVSVSDSRARLFRHGVYPPLRGTILERSDDEAVLYTRGGVEFYRTYPGMYVPTPLLLRRSESETPILSLAEEVLALTKLNWNNTQFDGGDPITIHAARRVGDVLKYIAEGQTIEPQYRYYM
jgi:cellobiose-specific phosphotransferase system component IIB